MTQTVTQSRGFLINNRTGEEKEVTDIYNPSNKSTYSLAISYFIGNFENVKDEEVVREVLKTRVSSQMDRTIRSLQINDIEVRHEETLRLLTERNALKIIESELDLERRETRDYDNESHSYLPKDYERTGINRMIFNHRLQRRLGGIATSPRIEKTCEDYELVRAVLKDSSRFSELENLCRGPLRHFLEYEKIKILDEESQRQEGLLTIWRAAKNYRADGFARFTTMARKSLHFRFCNLLTYSQADCRRANLKSLPMGGGGDSEDTPLAHEVSGISHKLWKGEQRSQLNVPDEKSDYWNPFGTAPFAEHRDSLEGRTNHAVVRRNKKVYENRHGQKTFAGNLQTFELITDDNLSMLDEEIVELRTDDELRSWETDMLNELKKDRVVREMVMNGKGWMEALSESESLELE